MIQPYVNHWDEAMALMLHPINATSSLMKLFRSCNETLYLANDRSSGVCSCQTCLDGLVLHEEEGDDYPNRLGVLHADRQERQFFCN